MTGRGDDGVLAGVRVIDLGRGIAGAAATHLLWQAGAEVIRVERPGGDPERALVGFTVWGRGVRSVVLDLSTDSGRAELDRLLGRADVLVHSLTPAAAKEAGLDDGRLAASFPRLVVSAITGLPAGHRDADFPVSETLVSARLGLMDEQPGHRDGPVFIRTPLGSWLAAWLAVIGVAARLIHRQRAGMGGVAHTSIAQGMLAPMTMHWMRAERPTPGFSRLSKNRSIPLHRCSDGRWIHVHYAPDGAPLMRQGLEQMGREAVERANAQYGTDPTAPNLGANKVVFATRPSHEWLAHLWEHDVAAQPAAEFGAVYFDEQARVNGYVVTVDDQALGPTLEPGVAYHTSPAPRTAGAVSPAGADTAALLEDDESVSAPPSPIPHGSDAPPLAGLKVVDFGAYMAGPFGPMLLAQLGADVVKVEPPGGEAMRYLETGFISAARGKRALALDLADARSRPVVEALVRWADVVHHNMRRPAARKLGVDHDSLVRIKPDLVTCHVSSYGPRGPRADWPGYDQMFQSSCGWEVMNGGAGNPPMWLRFGMCDHFAAVASVYAILLAVYHRERTGEGQETAASLLGATVLTVSETVARPNGTVLPYATLDHEQTGVAPERRIYRCSDGWLAVDAEDDNDRAAFWRLAGTDPVSLFAAGTVATAVAAARAAGVLAEPVRSNQCQPFLDDEANRAAGLVSSATHPFYGRVDGIGAFWSFGDLPLALGRPAPNVGQHSREILADLGFSAAEIAALEAAEVVRVTAVPWAGSVPSRTGGPVPKVGAAPVTSS